MHLKRFQAPTLAEALAQVERECGRDALLVETKHTARGCVVLATDARSAAAAAVARERAREAAPAGPRRERAVPLPRPESGRRWTRGFAPVAARALEFGLDARVLTAIEKAMIGTRVALDRPGDPAVASVAARILRSMTNTVEPTLADHRLLALVGPTGVGKTTTLAKLAARAIRERGESLAILTIDTYRVAAVEQLRAFADMLGVPFEVAFTPQDLREALRRHAGCDRVLVDTSGRSPFDRDALRDLGNALAGVDLSVGLCLPAGARRSDTLVALDAYEELGPDFLIMTKWDETRVPGELLSLAVERGLAVSHVTVGQEVPEDIVPADPGALAAAAFQLDETLAASLV